MGEMMQQMMSFGSNAAMAAIVVLLVVGALVAMTVLTTAAAWWCFGPCTRAPLIGPGTEPGEYALETLKNRYARGEIDEQQFERSVEVLLRHQ